MFLGEAPASLVAAALPLMTLRSNSDINGQGIPHRRPQHPQELLHTFPTPPSTESSILSARNLSTNPMTRASKASSKIPAPCAT